MSDERPAPDALLKRTIAQRERESRAKLRVFFGFAAGVGKTFAMLESAHRLVAQGVDLVVGTVDTHGRKETAELVEGLETLPLKKIEYRGRTLDELDLDGALARKPEVILVDELAHSNVPGSRHKKRWQDVLELLERGIEVHTTLNVQHVESLNDVVAQITHVQVRETVPDSLLERADSIELVDLPPEELLERLQAGKVYLGEQAGLAARSFFKQGNLLALRELALRRTAERVDADVQAYREEHGVAETWATAERILVCVGPAPGSGRLVRAARRMSAGLRAPWVAAYVEVAGMPALAGDAQHRLDGHLRLAETLGARIVRLTGTKISAALLEYARRHNVTRIVLGKPTHPRIRDLVRGSLVDEVVRGSGDIDVHVISGDESRPAEVAEPRTEAEAPPTHPERYVFSAGIVLATSVIAFALSEALSLPDPEMLYLLAVMASAAAFGRGPSIFAALLSIASYDFLLVPPRFTFAIAEGRYVLTFATIVAVALVMSTLTTRLRSEQQRALAREERTRALYDLSRDLASAFDSKRIAEIIARHVSDSFGASSIVFLPDSSGAVHAIAAWPVGASVDPKDIGVVQWSLEHRTPAGKGTDTVPGAAALCVPIKTGAEAAGVIALLVGEGIAVGAEERGLLETLARQAGFALERTNLAEQARQAALAAKTEELRSSLLAAVSHDLRTPLAAITGAGTTLRDEVELPGDTRVELLATICDEAERLERLVSNLLDMTRLESDGVNLKREWVPLEEVVGTALARVEKQLKDRTIETVLPRDLPLVSLDPILFEQLLVNLLENAAKYTPAGSPVTIEARQDDDEIEVDVSDRGPGVPRGQEEKVFERFYRGQQAGAAGVGLGLPICRAIARAHGGTLAVEAREGGGARFRVRLPQPEGRPSRPPEAPEVQA
ncbi:MAG: sensor histidine kinase KdpD [Polyangiaceae bacterium]|nr:sensor histidine kinase KdpD [Polyangiaceae bacterium]